MTGRVVVLGSVNRDLVLSVPHHPRPGETLSATGMAEFPGGKGANQAVAAVRAGASTVLAGAIGADGFGEAMRTFLAGEGIDLSALARRSDHPTGLAVIAVDPHGQNCILVVPGANAALGAEDAAALEFRTGDLVIAPFEVPDSFILEGFRKARAAGARTLLNPAPMRAHDPALIGLTDLLVLNETEFAQLTGAADVPEGPALEAALAVALPDIPVLVLTRGPEGVLVRADGQLRAVPGHRVAVRDTTGAGDCFVGALAASLALGQDLEAALSRANRAAAISVTRDGAGASMPKASEIEAFGG
ncbi:MAG: ribokinase [Beijerinckiaceae bacterium]|nr:ribokinase [Beijerinckiaceae bacterium]